MEHPENNEAYKGLTVNQGVEQPSIVNPYLNLRKKPKRRQYSAAEYVEGIVKGDVTMLSQAVTLVESVKPEHQVLAQEVIEKCLPYSGNSIRIGISGVPGAGKSTSIDVFGLHVLEEKGGKLAVLAIDPSSERSKGSILGDKIRMEKLSVHPKSFIRPSPSAGSLGGVARKTRETIILCEAAGFDKIFVETVGVGQSETAVHSMVDFFLLIQLAGTGDELQGIKRGIMEMADGIVINKADGDNLERAKLAATQFRNALHAPATSSTVGIKPMTATASPSLPPCGRRTVRRTRMTSSTMTLMMLRANMPASTRIRPSSSIRTAARPGWIPCLLQRSSRSGSTGITRSPTRPAPAISSTAGI